MRTAYRTCPLCEATCGLAITVDDASGQVTRVRGDAEDVFSQGFLCPKGVALADLHDDPDRVRTPLVRGTDGELAPATWDEAFAAVAEGLGRVQAEGGRDAVAVYLGNPSAHGIAPLVYGRALLKALGTRNVFSASTVDQYPKQLASGLMFGTASSVPVPDLDRTDFLLVLGANPMASNGSLMTAPNVRGRLRAIRSRGGKVVVVDPRRTRTAAEADEHLAIRPGTDALLLFALVHVVLAEGLGPDLDPELYAGLDEVRELSEAFTPEAVADPTGLDAEAIRRLARDLAAAPAAAVYGRIGTTTQAFGTTASWLVDVLNAVTGNLDRPGGAMWTTPRRGQRDHEGRARPGPRDPDGALGLAGARARGDLRRAARSRRWPRRSRRRARAASGRSSRSRATPCCPRRPASGSPRRSTSWTSWSASTSTSTRRRATPTSSCPSRRRSSAPTTTSRSTRSRPRRGELVRARAAAAGGCPGRVGGPPAAHGRRDGPGRRRGRRRARRVRGARLCEREAPGLDPDAVLAALAPRVGPARVVDLLLRTGPYGEGFPALGAPGPGTLSLAALEAAPHGVDLGALRPRLPGLLRTPSGKVELAPPMLAADVERLHAALDAPVPDLVLIGRRHLRSNNSWMHNLPSLVSGPARCTLQVHPDDAARLDLADGAPARVSSRAGAVEAVVEVTDDVRPGVVSLPHGWGHDLPGVELGVAGAHAGVNANVLTDAQEVEPLSGTAILNGIPVEVAPVRAAAGALA
jgi:anaerobic selenocysteine-containing dehydrogenase